MQENMLEMRGVTKTFGSTVALDDVYFSVKPGEVHALLGENGAGKSTLMKILIGVYKPDAGEVFVDGQKVSFSGPREAAEGGVGLIFQELNLVPTLTVLENAFLGRLKTKSFGAVDRKKTKDAAAVYKTRSFGFVDWKHMRTEFVDFMKSIDFEIDPSRVVSDISVAEKQMVEIARALMQGSRIIVMDEPTATLTTEEIRKLFAIIRLLKEKGVTVVYISHRLEEVFQICDRATVLRDGKKIETVEVSQTSKPELIEKMVGRSMDFEFPKRIDCVTDEVMLDVAHLFTPGFLRDISFNLRRGEILGIAGLVGSGRSEIARAVFGADRVEKGEFTIRGKKVAIHSTMDAKALSIGLVPEDRKEEGLCTEFSVVKNITVTNLPKVVSKGLLSRRKEVAESEALVKGLGVKTPSVFHRIDQLSGGNQQKVVLAKWMFNNADILILDEPTRGIDVGAKYEIYLLMQDMAKKGKAVILISSELPEIFALSDRILVMYEGTLRTCVENSLDLKPEDVMKFALG